MKKKRTDPTATLRKAVRRQYKALEDAGLVSKSTALRGKVKVKVRGNRIDVTGPKGFIDQLRAFNKNASEFLSPKKRRKKTGAGPAQARRKGRSNDKKAGYC